MPSPSKLKLQLKLFGMKKKKNLLFFISEGFELQFGVVGWGRVV